MTAILKAMSEGKTGGTAFMEDYTYHLEPDKPPIILAMG